MTDAELERFMAHIEFVPPGTCWIWMGSDSSFGYGQLRRGSRTDGTRRLVKAHRESFEHFKGPLSPGLEPDHTCSNRPCVNPAHLEAVTKRENQLRAIRRRRDGLFIVRYRRVTLTAGIQDSRWNGDPAASMVPRHGRRTLP